MVGTKIQSASALAAILSFFVDQSTAACPSNPWFAYENAQLTESAIASSGNPDLFRFGADPSVASSSRLFTRPQCKTYPGDPLWPSNTVWSLLNVTLGGALIKTTPLAASCYQGPNYNAAQCQYVTENWSNPRMHVEDPTSAMFPIFQGRTCLPPTHPSFQNNTACTLGGYASYSVAVMQVKQIQLAINFARLTNVRLVVHNTGHDFADKSIGAGSLSIWTHKLKDISFLPSYTDCRGRSGPAFKLGAGVETEEVYKAAEANNVTVVGGECRTVGIAGGYIAGGGHSPMSTLAGMGADQVLSMDVILPNGRFVTVNEDCYPDLFWALRGGGGSTYGVVTSVTVRAYPQIPVTTLSFAFTTGPNVTADTFFAGVGAYFKYFDTITQAGAFGYWLVLSIGPGQYLFSMMPMWGGNLTTPQFTSLVQPFLDDLTDLGIPFDPVFREYPSFYQTYIGTWPNVEAVGGADNHAASRLFPKENFESGPGGKLNETLAAVRYVVEDGAVIIGYNIKAATNPFVNQTNAVNPAWRKALGFFILSVGFPPNAPDSVIAERSEKLTNDWMARWRQVSPGAGSYLSEGDINEPDFQQSFYGAEFYPRLKKLKEKYDPTGLFYAHKAVGSEDWEIQGQVPYFPTQNGRLCRKQT
ncbi:hypothetical protein QBC35DRAFT_509406 [Podospora australis]|uniref:FAD-binding PCMH-type domain-containing protein n=1 Tax=Podospora australis TaxID=1536484 RepID=A0AAN6WJ39_9PEZI|nr:hypothetical protein QBC35DRAFT_509406 [Podospora australis]